MSSDALTNERTACQERHKAVQRKTPATGEFQELLIDAWVRLAELIDVCAKQQEVGSLRLGQETFVRAQRLLDELTALEQMMRPS
jgi:hypothetical protein